MNNIISIFQRNQQIREFSKCISKEHFQLLVNNTTHNHNALMAYKAYLDSNESVVYVANNIYKATSMYETLCTLAGVENVNYYVVDEIVSTEVLAVSNEFKFERIHTINSILKGEKKIIVTHPNALLRLLQPKNELQNNVLNFEVSKEINVKEVLNTLVKIGYKRAASTTQVGSFSVRGEIIDIFPINSDNAIRIDLFDNEIEAIKLFDVNTQKSNKKISKISVYPINEIVYDNTKEIIENIRKDITVITSDILNDLHDIECYNNLERIQKYIYYFTKEPVKFLDYLDEKIVIFDEVSRSKENYEKTILELYNFLENKQKNERLKISYLLDFYELFVDNNKQIYFTEFKQGLVGFRFTDLIDLQGYYVIDYKNDIKNLCEDLRNTKKTIILGINKEETKSLLIEILKDKEIKYNICLNENYKKNCINIMSFINGVSIGFIDDFEIINDSEIFKTVNKAHKFRSSYQNTTPINSKEDLKIGDYVVHYDYGIGQYLGIKTIELHDNKNDYIYLKYDNMELYVPIEKINLIEKYQGSEDSVPKLNNIGNKEWEKKKARIRERLESIAKDLISLQAKRENTHGFKYDIDNEIQTQFENDFEFKETVDQQKAIDDIKRNMEEGSIIDRLVCGDVGYGKTEVAMRAAMKTVLGGMQVAYLAPTTILTRQHYYTFKERFEKYGVKIGLLNRLITPRIEKETIEGLKKGTIDIVIGTHKLLNDDIRYKNLGLLIVDEEQRFGVTHKEKIKQYKNNINVLTLTATPIPRTLQMSIMGIRQLSLIETPPQNRYPIQTYVLEQNDTIIREAIYREMGRNGQVFYLHNRISDLDRIYRKLKRMIPDAKIIMAHGQMDKNALEDAVQSFIDKEYDVMLCTTIIETGIDIPNSNTLIVDMADRLGLAQMYQIRGRVGRSDRVSYAYFMYEENKVLTETGVKRLNAIKEFTTLGSGYKIAVRDLAIRGAGDLLGKEQSGFIDSIGLDMYIKMLTEEINKIKGIKEKEVKNNYNVTVSKHVSDKYVSDDDIKIFIHKEIASIATLEQRNKVIEELIDRFGPLTDEIKIYIDKQYMEGLATKIGIETIRENDMFVEIVFSQERSSIIDGSVLFKKAYDISDNFNFSYANKKIIMKYRKINDNKQWINRIITLLECI